MEGMEVIPDHLIEKAARGIWAMETTSEWPGSSSIWTASARNRARAALEAVAADIWDEGCEHGGRNGHSDSWRQDEEDPDLAHWPYDDNPYRNENT